MPALHEPLRIRANMPHAAVPPGCFLFDLGLEAIYKVWLPEISDAESKP